MWDFLKTFRKGQQRSLADIHGETKHSSWSAAKEVGPERTVAGAERRAQYPPPPHSAPPPPPLHTLLGGKIESMEKSKGAGPHLASIEVLIEGSAAIAAVKAKQLDL